jgi:hypothetical protein
MLLLLRSPAAAPATSTLKLSVGVRNARLNAIESTIGLAPVLQIRTGPPPAAITDADTGTVLVDMTLPSNWMGDAAAGAKGLAGLWQDPAAVGGTAGHFRLYAAGGTTPHLQGTVTAVGGGGDLELETIVLTTNSPVTVTTFTLTDGNG